MMQHHLARDVYKWLLFEYSGIDRLESVRDYWSSFIAFSYVNHWLGDQLLQRPLCKGGSQT